MREVRREYENNKNKRDLQTEMNNINVVDCASGLDLRGNSFFLEAHAHPSGFPITHNLL